MNKLSKLLLATTCLTAVSAAPAEAVPEVEPNDPFAIAQVLPVGTTEVTAGLQGSIDSDFFKLIGLQAGASFTVTLSTSDFATLFEDGFDALNSSEGGIDSDDLFDGAQVTGLIPGDGILVLNVFANLEENSGGSFDYTLSIDAPLQPVVELPRVPEPSLFTLMATGAAGLGVFRALRRGRKTS